MNDLIFKNIDNELEQIGNDCLKGKELVVTKFGNAKIDNAYYQITTHKEGNWHKYLHRLIWEDYYGKPVPKGYVIHHINGNKLDNRIQNLQCVKYELHTRFHMKGRKQTEETKRKISEYKKGRKRKPFSDEWKRKMSEAHNTTGYYRVHKKKDIMCKQGFMWGYKYPDENGKQKTITRVNLDDLEKEVKKRGLPWIKLGGD